MEKVKPVLGTAAAVLTLLVAVLIPFVLVDLFTRGVAATGIRIDPSFSGGDVSHVLDRGSYQIVVNRPVRKRAPLQHLQPFVQLKWTPASVLPARVRDEVDLWNDGSADAVVSFAVPRDRKQPLEADVTGLSSPVKPQETIRRDSFSSLISWVGDSVVVRIPLIEN